MDQKDMAHRDYCRGFKYREIAERYQVSMNTVKSWVRRYGWKRSDNINEINNKANKENTKAAEEKSTTEEIREKIQDQLDAKTINSMARKDLQRIHDLERLDLTDQEVQFIYEYCRRWNPNKAAAKVFELKPRPAAEKARELMANPEINRGIDYLKRQIREGVALEEMAIIQKYIDAAFSDLTDYINWGSVEIPRYDYEGNLAKDEDGNTIMQPVNYVRLKDDAEVDGSLVESIKQGKEGVSIQLISKEKALDRLEKYMDLIPDHHRRMIEEKKIELQEKKLEIEQRREQLNEDDDESTGIIMMPEPEKVEGS